MSTNTRHRRAETIAPLRRPPVKFSSPRTYFRIAQISAAGVVEAGMMRFRIGNHRVSFGVYHEKQTTTTLPVSCQLESSTCQYPTNTLRHIESARLLMLPVAEKCRPA